MRVSRWQEVRAKRSDVTEDDRTWARQAQQERIRAYKLSQARRRQARTQVEVASEMGVSQARISELERGDIEKTEIRTLRSYAEALGGHLRVILEFDDGDRVQIA